MWLWIDQAHECGSIGRGFDGRVGLDIGSQLISISLISSNAIGALILVPRAKSSIRIHRQFGSSVYFIPIECQRPIGAKRARLER